LSKFYGIAAARRPTIAIPARWRNRAAHTEHNCGLVIESGQADALAEAITRLSNVPQSLVAMGERARAMVEAHFTRHQALDRWSSKRASVVDAVDENSC
jgi:hypothetical protein